ncbi:M15 family metallopeptidase [Mucilaginibacter sp.]
MIRHVLLLILLFSGINYQDNSKRPDVSNTAAYYDEVKQDPDKKLVEIKKVIPGIALDIRYATTNNFAHHQMYPQARGFARQPVVLALKQVEAALKLQGLGLKIYDAYRPYAVTVKFYELIRDTDFVADPEKGSKHNRGCAIDLTIIYLKTGKELDMPTGFDSFSKKAASNYIDLPKQEIINRALLKSVMQAHGFTELPTEWWHFDYNGWKNYELLDVPFAAL